MLCLQSKFQFAEDLHNESLSKPNQLFIILFLILHILSYIAHFFRKKDIRINGKPDLYGVYSAQKETIISCFELFLSCIFIGYTAKYLQEMDTKVFHEEGIQSYFLIVDSVITFLYKPFIYLGQLIKIEGEIKKNLYTLYFK